MQTAQEINDDYSEEEYTDDELEIEADSTDAEPVGTSGNGTAPAGLGKGLGMGLLGMKPVQPATKKATPAGAKEWSGLMSMPAATQTALHSILGSLRSANKSELTILLLGKGGAGKTSTASSIFAEKVGAIHSLENGTPKPVVVSRAAAGFTVNVIDTPSLLQGDSVNESSLSAIGFEVSKHPVDAVVFVERLDLYRVEPADKMMMEAITDHFGGAIWKNTIIGFTHGAMRSPPVGMDHRSFVQSRSEAMRKAIKAAGGSGSLPAVLIENSNLCTLNDEGQKVVGPNNVPWLPEMMKQIADLVTSSGAEPFKFDGKQKRSNPNKKRRWLIPLVFAAQIAFKKFVFERLVEEDAATGDQYGPYDPEFVEAERERRKQNKEDRDKAASEKEARRRASGRPAPEPVVPTPAAASKPAATPMFDDSDDEDDWD